MAYGAKGVILSGSHASTYEDQNLRAPQAVYELGVPVLGICYGMFTMAVQLKGRSGAQRQARVRLCGSARARAYETVRRHPGLRHARGPRHAQGLDEPRRQGHRDAAGVQAHGLDRVLPDCGHGGRGAQVLRRPVPSRGHPHEAGQGDPESFRARHLRLRHRLEHARLRDRGGGEDPRAGRQGRSDPGPVGRRRFLGRRRADPQGDRQAAHLRVRRPRLAAPGRGEAGDGDFCRASWRQGHPRRCERRIHGQARGRVRPRSQAQDHRQGVRRGLPARVGEDQECQSGSRRARSIPT